MRPRHRPRWSRTVAPLRGEPGLSIQHRDTLSELGWDGHPPLPSYRHSQHLIKRFSHSQIRNGINDVRGELQCFPAVQVSYADLSATMEKDEVRTIAVFPAPYDRNVRGAFDVHPSPAEGDVVRPSQGL